METNEAAAALLNMESPNNILDEKRMSKLFSILYNTKKTVANTEHETHSLHNFHGFPTSFLRTVPSYGALLESDLTYAPLRPDQMDNGALDMSLDEDTSSMDEIPQKCPLKAQKKTKGNTIALLLLFRPQELSLVLKFQGCR